ncbi:TetR/AcrR family transcriptional regulator [Aliicoccus persicus]|uniref:Transcriptional regulator, TetR family n=1 Tax=Aliicoccus persicus TaxID=930138 RepID=A0A662Z5Y1_9STAP|nr:TetR/AcrR family transcriptional regulator [Aliicoccus persicus]SEW07241.1 transcriptional regulator, TetR family [Aliicoccus persicus]
MTEITDKRAVLDDAAYRVFFDVGFKAASISKITEVAGMATGSFYNYYQSKEEVFTKIFIAENKRIYDEMLETVNFDDDVIDIFDEAIERIYSTFKENKIVAEALNPETIKFLEGALKEQNVEIIFNDYIQKFTDKKLRESGYSEEQMEELYKVSDLLRFFQGHLLLSDNPEYLHSYRTLMRYYVKGVFNS